MKHWLNSVRCIRGALALTVLLLLPAGMVCAQVEAAPEPPVNLDTASQARYDALLKNLRCLVCQNESLADSDAPLAADLRVIVRKQVAAGKSNAEIRRYLTDRYGDFVLYRPPFQANTLLLWAGPFVLVLLGVLAVVRYLRRDVATAPQADAERLRKLLDGDP